AARVAGFPYTAVEMNPMIVRAARDEGVPIVFGDATQRAVLEHLGIRYARVAVVVISDAAATRMITALVRSLAPGCRIISRTRHLSEVEPLRQAGADVVIPEELETSVEIVARLLASYLVPRREIEAFVSELRAGGYEMLRKPDSASPTLADLGGLLTDVEITTLRVREGCAIIGGRLADTDLRRLYGISVLAIRRGDLTIPNPGGDDVVEAGDALVVLGLAEEIAAASELFGWTPAPGSE
ncbi:MAG TPA: NAD-binding protein, partial [Longimicrobiales bacterium]|nr:NAD-binding protein [Longimicrobiales bacterium]